jgi:DNA-directed RNA polymerase subunit K/omega
MENQPVVIGTSVQSLGIEPFFQGTDNLYYSVVVLSRRANQIGQQMKQDLHEKLAEFGPVGENLDEVVENREQIEIAKHYEALPKPTLLAIEEYLNHQLAFRNDTEQYIL